MNEYFCKKCGKSIHPKRVALGYKDTCVDHSEAVRFTGHIVTEGSSSEEVSSIEVIRDPKIAAELHRLTKNFGDI